LAHLAEQVKEPTFKPYISPAEKPYELTFRSLFFGGIFGILFGAVTVYVGLRAGLTVAASIPIAVLSISLLRAVGRLLPPFGRGTILENNIVQTTGSAGESVAGGVIFTLPALIFLGFGMDYWRIFLLALIGGWLGVFFMIPLRRQLIVKEHGNLLYPEGTACADVLIAGDKGGSIASRVFYGLGLGALYTLFQNGALFSVWPDTPAITPKSFPGASLRCNTTSEYLGVGYIIGPRIAGVLFSGGVFAWLVVMPAIKFFGGHATVYPGTVPIDQMSSIDLWKSYIRPMGAGAVAAAGLITLLKTTPTIIAALRAGAKDLGKGAKDVAGVLRTDKDMSMKVALGGALLVMIMMWAMLTFKPVPGAYTSGGANVAAAIFVVIFGFLFVTVSSRITGLIGTSSNPISGMAIATLMATCAVFLILHWTAAAFGALAISIGGVVCIASANAGNTSQDLKTGYLVGATPRNQQIGLLVGVAISVLAIGLTLIGMNQGLAYYKAMPPIAMDINNLPPGVEIQSKSLDLDHPQIRVRTTDQGEVSKAAGSYWLLNALGSKELPDGKYLYDPQTQKIDVQWVQGIGSEKAPAPQARLMATVISGILNQRLPWGLVMLGVFLVVGVELLGIRSLSFAVGFYIDIATTCAMFIGGLVRWFVDSKTKKFGGHPIESDVSPGSLFASGLIAAGGIVGLIGIAFAYLETKMRDVGTAASTQHADTLRHTLSWGNWTDKATGIVHFRLSDAIGGSHPDAVANIIGMLVFFGLASALYHFARKPLGDNEIAK
jgi:putative OPT family oligopeptide transporter